VRLGYEHGVTAAPRPPSLGLRHAALRVRDLAAAEEFFVRALAPDRAARPASAAEFLQELEKALGACIT
jgi:hypothetical protein